jgi:hypothetical protein
MKKLKFIIVALTVSLFALSSCQDNGPVTAPQPEASKSIALRTVLNQLKATNDISGRFANTTRSANDQDDFCFDFVYPFQLEYNTGALVTVESFDGLIQILINETSDLYIVGIVFPFDIVFLEDGTTVTINSEEDFIEALTNCDDFDVWDDDDVVVDCFEFVYPIEMVGADGTTVTISSDNELMEFFAGQGQMYEPEFVFPITVVNLDNEEIVVENIYEFFELMDDCYAYDGGYDDCNCMDVYEPVCVYDSTSDMTIPFPNECVAICAGFTENDFVDCNFDDIDCEIDDLEVTVGDCNGDGTYSITINFEYENTNNEYFDVYVNDYIFIGNFQIADLPVTIDNFPVSGFDFDYLSVNINDNDGCWEGIEWEAPDCGGIEFNFMDYVGSCFEFIYPIVVTFQGVSYEVNSFAQLQEYFNPQTMDAEIQFPVQIEELSTGETLTIQNMDELEDFIEDNCG